MPNIVTNPQTDIWIAEGEYRADKLAKLGLVVTTSGDKQCVTATRLVPISETQNHHQL